VEPPGVAFLDATRPARGSVGAFGFPRRYGGPSSFGCLSRSILFCFLLIDPKLWPYPIVDIDEQKREEGENTKRLRDETTQSTQKIHYVRTLPIMPAVVEK
jgi:hypothetical protein